MFKNHRIEVIKRILEEKKYIEVSELSDILDVSEVTIRRDLNKLEEAGLVIRSFGGATLTNQALLQESIPTTSSYLDQSTAKQNSLIGQIAFQHIEEHDFIYIGSGSESQQLAIQLAQADKSISVATNDIQIAQILATNRDIDTILTGGMISGTSNILKGELLLHTLERLVIQKAFISIDGISLEKGFSTNSYDTQSIIRFFNHSICKLFVMFESQKANKNAPYLLGDCQMPLCLISDFNLPPDFSAYYFERNIPLFTALT